MVSRALIVVLLSLLLAACGSAPSWQDRQNTHIVRKGETLFSIAWRYGRTTEQLASWNKLGDGSLIHPGQVIRLSPPSGYRRPSAPRPRASQPATRPLPEIPARPSPK